MIPNWADETIYNTSMDILKETAFWYEIISLSLACVKYLNVVSKYLVILFQIEIIEKDYIDLYIHKYKISFFSDQFEEY